MLYTLLNDLDVFHTRSNSDIAYMCHDDNSLVALGIGSCHILEVTAAQSDGIRPQRTHIQLRSAMNPQSQFPGWHRATSKSRSHMYEQTLTRTDFRTMSGVRQCSQVMLSDRPCNCLVDSGKLLTPRMLKLGWLGCRSRRFSGLHSELGVGPWPGYCDFGGV